MLKRELKRNMSRTKRFSKAQNVPLETWTSLEVTVGGLIRKGLNTGEDSDGRQACMEFETSLLRYLEQVPACLTNFGNNML